MSEELPVLIAFSGHKESGKTSGANFIASLILQSGGFTTGARVSDDGKLLIQSEDGEGEFDLYRRDAPFVKYLSEAVWPTIKFFSFADIIKDFLRVVLGVDPNDNGAKTTYLWESMPVPSGQKKAPGKGFMTVRDLKQFFGTDIVRNSFGKNVWANALINRIKEDAPLFAVVDDVRYPNEVEAIQKAGGKVIRLTRQPSKDVHESETALDDYHGFDLVIDNTELDLHQTHEQIFNYLKEVGVIGEAE